MEQVAHRAQRGVQRLRLACVSGILGAGGAGT